MMILSIDLAKAKSLFCWYETTDQSHELRSVVSMPSAFHDALVQRQVDRVVIEICDMAGWVKDLCDALQIPIQVANVNVEGWRWKNVKSKTDKTDVLKLARLSAANDLKTVYLPDRRTRHWRSLILYRHKLVDRRVAVKNAIHALLVAEGRPMRGGSRRVEQRVDCPTAQAGQADRSVHHRRAVVRSSVDGDEEPGASQ